MFYDRYVFLCKQKGVSPSRAAVDMGISKSAVTKWKNSPDAEASGATIQKMQEYFGVSAAYILGIEGIPTKIGNLDILPVNGNQMIPILGRVSAGLPLYAEQQIEGYTCTNLNGGAEYFALRVQGDSMTGARINEGDLLIVRRQETAEDGQIVVAMVDDDEATVKRIYRTGSTVTLMPQSLNPKHQPQIYDTGKTRIRIIGLVVRVEFDL